MSVYWDGVLCGWVDVGLVEFEECFVFVDWEDDGCVGVLVEEGYFLFVERYEIDVIDCFEVFCGGMFGDGDEYVVY